MSNYHVSLDSHWSQIQEHTYCNSVMAALYYAGVELEKCNIHTENIQTDRQTEKAITEATLIPWIAGLSGPIKNIPTYILFTEWITGN